MRIGLIGNQTGSARQLVESGFEPIFHAAGTVNSDGLEHPALHEVERFAEFFEALDHPRHFLLDLPLGQSIDRIIDEAYVVMEPGDVVLDPTGSYWGDTLRRYRRMRHRSLYYVDLAFIGDMPGGIVLAAGDKRGVALASPVLQRLAATGTVIQAGGSGAAHFALTVRAGVANAVTHALSEARQLLEAYPNEPEADAVVTGLWPPSPPATDCGAWLLDDAVRLHAAIPLLAQGIMLEMAAALEERRSFDVAPRVGGFVHPEEIL